MIYSLFALIINIFAFLIGGPELAAIVGGKLAEFGEKFKLFSPIRWILDLVFHK